MLHPRMDLYSRMDFWPFINGEKGYHPHSSSLTPPFLRHYRDEAVVTVLIVGARVRSPFSSRLVSQPIEGGPKEDPFGFTEEACNKNIG